MKHIITGLLLLSLAGCDGLEKLQPKPLDGVPVGVSFLTRCAFPTESSSI